MLNVVSCRFCVDPDHRETPRDALLEFNVSTEKVVCLFTISVYWKIKSTNLMPKVRWFLVNNRIVNKNIYDLGKVTKLCNKLRIYLFFIYGFNKICTRGILQKELVQFAMCTLVWRIHITFYIPTQGCTVPGNQGTHDKLNQIRCLERFESYVNLIFSF